MVREIAPWLARRAICRATRARPCRYLTPLTSDSARRPSHPLKKGARAGSRLGRPVRMWRGMSTSSGMRGPPARALALPITTTPPRLPCRRRPCRPHSAKGRGRTTHCPPRRLSLGLSNLCRSCFAFQSLQSPYPPFHIISAAAVQLWGTQSCVCGPPLNQSMRQSFSLSLLSSV